MILKTIGTKMITHATKPLAATFENTTKYERFVFLLSIFMFFKFVFFLRYLI